MEYITAATMSIATYLSFDYIKDKTVEVIRKVHNIVYDYYDLFDKMFKENGFTNAIISSDKKTCSVSFYVDHKLYTICIPYDIVSKCEPKSKFNDYIIGAYTDKNLDLTKYFLQYQGPNYDLFKHTGFVPTLSCIFTNDSLKKIKEIEVVTKELNTIIIDDIYKNKDIQLDELLKNSVKQVEMIEK